MARHFPSWSENANLQTHSLVRNGCDLIRPISQVSVGCAPPVHEIRVDAELEGVCPNEPGCGFSDRICWKKSDTW